LRSSEQKEETEQGPAIQTSTPSMRLAVKALLAYSLERVKMGIERNSRMHAFVELRGS